MLIILRIRLHKPLKLHLGPRLPTFRFAGRAYPQLARIVRMFCAVADRWLWPLVAVVAVKSSPGNGQPSMSSAASGAPLPVVSGLARQLMITMREQQGDTSQGRGTGEILT